MTRKILILSNHPSYTYDFRKEIIFELIDQGYSVIVSCPHGNKIDRLIEKGVIFEETTLDRHSKNIFNEFKLINYYRNIIKKHNPDIILTYTIKPNLYGGIIGQIYRIPYIPNVTGLGNSMTESKVFGKLIIELYRLSFRKVSIIFFQNEYNLRYLNEKINKKSKSILIPGSGVNHTEFQYVEYPKNDRINILYFGRIMQSKGIHELLNAASSITKNIPNVDFHLVGFVDDEKTKKILKDSVSSNILYSEYRDNVASIIENADAVILPSHHEGMSNSLLEAASMGRPLLASNIPGCKEIIDDGINGYLFEPKDSNSIYEAIKKFVSLSYEERKEMGRQSRLKVEREFDRNIVVNEYLTNIKEILEG